ncbi:MAG: hypothetical protein PSX71_04930 [bacterium]|nr:hypothetical protein [bacterium]
MCKVAAAAGQRQAKLAEALLHLRAATFALARALHVALSALMENQGP